MVSKRRRLRYNLRLRRNTISILVISIIPRQTILFANFESRASNFAFPYIFPLNSKSDWNIQVKAFLPLWSLRNPLPGDSLSGC